MKKPLLITGKSGERRLKEILEREKISAKIHVSKVDVAAFLTTEMILKELVGEDLEEIERVIVPGTVKGNLEVMSEKLEVPCVRGPENLDKLEEFLLEEGEEKDGVVKEIPKIMAEIVDAPKLSREELGKVAEYYVNSGADIIDLGMLVGEDNSEKIPEIVTEVRKKVKVPLSIDTLNEREILAAVDNGVDLVVSLDFSNYKVVKKVDVPAVIIPRRDGQVPKKARERIKLLEELMEKLKEEGFDKIIVDPILAPVNFGFLESIRAYAKFREKYPKVPLFMGVGNITELMDVDSVGVNGLLAGMAAELGVNILLTTEGSAKTKGSVEELSTAVKMMSLAKSQQKNPKDLGEGLNLLRLKKKRFS